jgi:SAM-dependent methyltransferase
MVRPFAKHYDLVYADKNYGKDIADFAEIAGADRLRNMRVLEIGAGTGNQSLRLAHIVRDLVAVEIDQDFYELLAAKVSASELPGIRPERRPIGELPPEPFDAAVAFFHVLNYVDPADMPAFLSALAARMKPGAPLVADLWNGVAALGDPPKPEMREKQPGSARVLQRIAPRLDPRTRRLTLDYEIDIDEGGSRAHFRETLELYLWLQEEIAVLLAQAGFHKIAFYDYARFPMPATDRSWRVWLHAARG